jgi:hypothetical protein
MAGANQTEPERRARSFPPVRLSRVSDHWLTRLRRVWFMALAFAIVLDIAGFIFAMRVEYDYGPALARVSLSQSVENDGTVTVESLVGLQDAPTIPPGSRIARIGAEPVPRDTPLWTLAKRVRAKDGEVVDMTIVAPGGRMIRHRVTASEGPRQAVAQVAPIKREVRIGVRMILAGLTCLTLIACAVLLFVRRPQDPVALLFSFSFLLFASVIDPPLQMWLATGMGQLFDAIASLGWLLLVLGLAVFPDGRFNPRPVRWVLVFAPLVALGLTVDNAPVEIATFAAFVAPLFLILCHVVKYRRFGPGIERQQIKWAAFGFALGLTLLTLTFVLVAVLPSSSVDWPIYSLLILALFSLGFMVMALGLLVALMRFRLWEADRVISRSAISVTVTLAVGIIWTLSVDMLKVAVEWLLGEENTTVATFAGGVLAAGIFAPTQALALRWAKRRLAGDESRIQRLIDRLAVWRATETPQEIAIRTLSALSAAVHCSAAALLVNGSRGLEVLAARDVERPEELNLPSHDATGDPRFALVLPLEDEDGPIGQLLVGRRSDLNRYNAAQLHGMEALTEPLAESLRAALKRSQQVEGLQLKLGTVEERLARLEQRPGLSPT